jgi:hypothetical protein
MGAVDFFDCARWRFTRRAPNPTPENGDDQIALVHDLTIDDRLRARSELRRALDLPQ